jgi:hypothetical protein
MDALRLDCVRSNGRLRSSYEGWGFVHRGDVTVGGPPGQRWNDGPVTWVSRYEMTLASDGRFSSGRCVAQTLLCGLVGSRGPVTRS